VQKWQSASFHPKIFNRLQIRQDMADSVISCSWILDVIAVLQGGAELQGAELRVPGQQDAARPAAADTLQEKEHPAT
jgi:hypothetical protein